VALRAGLRADEDGILTAVAAAPDTALQAEE
jgi:hypothetical protein